MCEQIRRIGMSLWWIKGFLSDTQQTLREITLRKVICYRLGFGKKTLLMFWLDALVFILAKVKRQTVILYWGYKSVRITFPSLPLHHNSTASRDFRFSISVEALLWGCHLDVKGLFLPTAPVPCHGLSLLSSPIAGLPWWGGREGEAILTDLWPPTMSSAWLQINSSACSHFFTFGLMMTEAFETLVKIVPITFLHLSRSQLRSHWNRITLFLSPFGIVSFCLLLFRLFAYSTNNCRKHSTIASITDTAPQWGEV